MDGGRTFLPLLSPHRFHPFDVSDPMADGQGRAWITAMDYHVSTYAEPGWMSRFGFDYIWLTETRSKNLLPRTFCLSDPSSRLFSSECKLGLDSSGLSDLTVFNL